MANTIHTSLNIRAALEDRELFDLIEIREDGRLIKSAEKRGRLIRQLEEGIECLPIGEACEGFDYSGGGCPGHRLTEDQPA